MADHDQQYLVELDANQHPNILFKQLMSRLSCFVLRPAAVPTRLMNDPEEEELPEEIDTDELMRTLGAKEMVAPRFRWRRSKWLRNCPVALHEGNMIPGKPEFAVSFLDKMYVLSSAEAMDKFLKNPRPYLLPPQPRPPCKITIQGPPLSGKTTLCHLLAQKYGAQVLDINTLIKPRMEEERKTQLQRAKEESTENAIITIKQKIKDEIEAAAKEAEQQETNSEIEETVAETDADLEKTEDEETDQEKDKEPVDGENEDKAEKDEVIKEPSEPTTKAPTPPPPVEVDDKHPEVIALVEAAMVEAEKMPVVLPPEVYIEIMEEAIKNVEKDLRKNGEDGPMNGGWILDNFPCTRDQWGVAFDKGLIPDDVIYLKDNSEEGKFLTKRWYKLNQTEIDAKHQLRVQEEARVKAKAEEEARIKAEEERLANEEAIRQAKEEERQRRLEEGEDLSDEEGVEDEEEEDRVARKHANKDEDDRQGDQAKPPPIREGERPEDTQTEDGDGAESTIEVIPEKIEDPLPPEGPEYDAYKIKRKDYDTEWATCSALITGNTGAEPVIIELDAKKEEGVMFDTARQLELPYQYAAWEYSGMDIDEEEEDLEADLNEEEEAEEEEESEDPNRSKKKPLGDVNYYCPVALKENGVLYPGNPEIGAKYREKV
ncbi:unnamed protein product, partial [Owenia fusiformis]